MKKICLLVMIFISVNVYSQEKKRPQYISLTYIKSTAADFESFEDNWVQVHNQLINDGKKLAWYLYKVKYPSGQKNEYDYIWLDILENWSMVEDPNERLNETIAKVHPDVDVNQFYSKTNQIRIIIYEQLFQIKEQALIDLKNPAQYILINEIKTVDGSDEEYENLERSYFKPFHQERVQQNLLNSWMLLKTTIPSGERFDFNYITLNGFDRWRDIIKNPSSEIWQKVHGETDFNTIHDLILSKRKTINIELWQLIAKAVGN